MRHKFQGPLVVALLCCVHLPAQAQLAVATAPDLQQMLLDLFGPSVTGIFNLQTLGAADYRGTFDGTASDLGLDSGIVLTNGDLHLAIGPNDTVEAGIFDGNGLVGDPDLTAIAGYPTQDASVLEFDFVPASDTINFHFVFGSEEYPEWVSNVIYNDVFAILLNGVNIALLPDASPVCVDNVNCFGANPTSYRCNDPMNDQLDPCAASFNCPDSVEETTIQYDGLTVPLHAEAVLTPGTMYHLKIGLADVSDNGADSGGFLSVSWSSPVTGVTSFAVDGPAFISPNPTTGSFRYHFPKSDIERFTIVDLAGRVIMSGGQLEREGTLFLPPSAGAGIYQLIADAPMKRHAVTLVVAP